MSDEYRWNPDDVTISDPSVSDAWKVCVIQGTFYGGNEYDGHLGARISSIFVILFVSTAFTLFPVVARKVPRLKVPEYVYSLARNFGTGVIAATAFVHLLDPAYGEIGPNTCVGMTGNWAIYSWVPAIVLVTIFFIFTLDLISSVYVERKYGIRYEEDIVTESIVHQHQATESDIYHNNEMQNGHNNDHQDTVRTPEKQSDMEIESLSESQIVKDFDAQIAAFLILEFGVIFHSVCIGLELGACGDEFSVLYPVLVFHQSFEGLGIGSRLSVIPFPKSKWWWPWALCIAYGLTTPISVAIGLGVRTKYDAESYTASIVEGTLDSISAGILIYTALVELLARDFIFNNQRTKSIPNLLFQFTCLCVGTGLMALLGKWA